MTKPPPTTERAIDALYQGPLGDFVASRNALVKALRASGDRDGANAVKGLAKPSLPAWAANQVFWKHPAIWSRLEMTAAALRRAHAGTLAEVGEQAAAHRQAVGVAVQAAVEALVEAGHAAPDATRRRLQQTSKALSSGSAPTARAGRLATDLDAAGFAGLAAMAGSLPGRRRTVVPFPGSEGPVANEDAPAAPMSRLAAARERALAGDPTRELGSSELTGKIRRKPHVDPMTRLAEAKRRAAEAAATRTPEPPPPAEAPTPKPVPNRPAQRRRDRPDPLARLAEAKRRAQEGASGVTRPAAAPPAPSLDRESAGDPALVAPVEACERAAAEALGEAVAARAAREAAERALAQAQLALETAEARSDAAMAALVAAKRALLRAEDH